MDLDYSLQFKKDYSRLKRSGQYNVNKIKTLLDEVITCFIDGKPLPRKYRDHSLKGEWNECRECHLQGDLLLIYLIDTIENVIILIRLGSHSELFKKY